MRSLVKGIRVSRSQIILGLIVLCGAFLRFYRLGAKPFWGDEAYQFAASLKAIGPMLKDIQSNVALPLDFLIEHLFLSLGANEFFARLPAATIGVFAIIAIYYMGKVTYGQREGLISALFLCLSVFHVYYSQEAHFYSLFLFLSISSNTFLLMALEGKREAAWWGYLVSTALGLYTHLFFLVLLLTHILFAFIYYWIGLFQGSGFRVQGSGYKEPRASPNTQGSRLQATSYKLQAQGSTPHFPSKVRGKAQCSMPKEQGEKSKEQRARLNKNLRRIIITASGLILIFIPWLRFLLKQISVDRTIPPELHIGHWIDMFEYFGGGGYLSIVISLLFLLGLISSRYEKRWALAWALLFVSLPLFLELLVLKILSHIFGLRYVIFVLPVLLVTASKGTTKLGDIVYRWFDRIGLGNRTLKTSSALGLVIFFILVAPWFYNYYKAPTKWIAPQDWKGASNFVKGRFDDNTLLVFNYMTPIFSFYIEPYLPAGAQAVLARSRMDKRLDILSLSKDSRLKRLTELKREEIEGLRPWWILITPDLNRLSEMELKPWWRVSGNVNTHQALFAKGLKSGFTHYPLEGISLVNAPPLRSFEQFLNMNRHVFSIYQELYPPDSFLSFAPWALETIEEVRSKK